MGNDQGDERRQARVRELAGLLLGADVAAGVNRREVLRYSEVIDEAPRHRPSRWKRCLRSFYRLRRRAVRYCLTPQRLLAARA